MKIYTQNDLIMAVMMHCLKYNTVSPACSQFFGFVKDCRTKDEHCELLERAEKLLDHEAVVPELDEIGRLIDLWHDLPKDGWEMVERQSTAN